MKRRSSVDCGGENVEVEGSGILCGVTHAVELNEQKVDRLIAAVPDDVASIQQA
jgi:hypothetical protein